MRDPTIRPPSTGTAAAITTTAGDDPLFDFSLSRYKALRTCERAVFYRYLGARDGGLRTALPAARALHRAKQLTDLTLLSGSIVHDLASAATLEIKAGRAVPTADELTERAHAVLDGVCRDARDPDRFYEAPDRVVGLREVVQRGQLRPYELARAWHRITTGIRTFLSSTLISDLQHCPRTQIVIHPRPVRFLLDSAVPVWIAVDLIYPHVPPRAGGSVDGQAPAPAPPSAGWGSGPPAGFDHARMWCVVDYKTGRPDPADEQLQLAIYSLYLDQVLRAPSTRGAYLGRIVRLRSPSAGTRAGAHHGLDADTDDEDRQPERMSGCHGTESWTVLTAADRNRVRQLVRSYREHLLQRVEQIPPQALSQGPRGLRVLDLDAAARAFPIAADVRSCTRCVFAPHCDGARRLRHTTRPAVGPASSVPEIPRQSEATETVCRASRGIEGRQGDGSPL